MDYHACDHDKGSSSLLPPLRKGADLGYLIALPAQLANQPAVLRYWVFVTPSSDHEDSATFTTAFLQVRDCVLASRVGGRTFIGNCSAIM